MSVNRHGSRCLSLVEYTGKCKRRSDVHKNCGANLVLDSVGVFNSLPQFVEFGIAFESVREYPSR